MTKFEIKQYQKLSNQLDQVEKKLKKIAIEIGSTNQTSIYYWSKLSKKSREAYDEARIIFTNWISYNLPKSFDNEIRMQIKRIKDMSFIPRDKKGNPIRINYLTAVNENSKIQMKSSIIKESIQYFSTGLDEGRKRLNRLMNLTQQILIDDETVRKTLEKGYIQGKGTIQGAKKALQKKFLDQAKDEKFIQVINKNGQTMMFNIKKYAEMVARTEILNGQSQATIATALDFGTDLVQVSSHNTTTEICQQYEGKIFSITGKDKDFPVLDQTPSFHPNPFTKDTEIYTNTGWKKINEIKIGEKCLSLKKDFNLEWANVIDKIKRYEKNVIKFKNKICEIKIAKDHNMFYETDWSRRKKQDNFKFVEAKKLLNKKSGGFFASSYYESKNEIDYLYCRFLGYYLSDGSIDGNKISIAKTDRNMPDRNIILNDLNKLFPNTHLSINKDSIRFSNKNLAQKLKKLNKGNKKYIPDEIMNASKNSIKNFLDGFILCDGHIKKGKKWKDYNFKESRMYFTTSKKMSDQIGELLIKIGKRPSFRTQKLTNKLLNFPNGQYKSKLDLYIISECNNRYISFQNMEIKEIEYNDFVYCVSLDKNFTLLTRTNGKVVWCGNCKHSLTILFRSVLESRGIQKYIDFSQGKTEIHPTRKSHIPISKRTK